MKVDVSLYANLRQYSPGGEKSFAWSLSPGATVKDLIAALAIPAGVKTVILVNGRQAGENTRLDPEDKITLFPPMEGG